MLSLLFEKIDHLSAYYKLFPSFAKINEFLRSEDLEALEPGRYEIDGDRLFVSIQQYETEAADKRPWECHRKYLDLQYVISGEEYIYVAPLDHLTECSSYDEQGDCILSNCDCPASALLLHAGDCVLLSPEEAHKPKCSVAGSSSVKKAVIKIAI